MENNGIRKIIEVEMGQNDDIQIIKRGGRKTESVVTVLIVGLLMAIVGKLYFGEMKITSLSPNDPIRTEVKETLSNTVEIKKIAQAGFDNSAINLDQVKTDIIQVKIKLDQVNQQVNQIKKMKKQVDALKIAVDEINKKLDTLLASSVNNNNATTSTADAESPTAESPTAESPTTDTNTNNITPMVPITENEGFDFSVEFGTEVYLMPPDDYGDIKKVVIEGKDNNNTEFSKVLEKDEGTTILLAKGLNIIKYEMYLTNGEIYDEIKIDMPEEGRVTIIAGIVEGR